MSNVRHLQIAETGDREIDRIRLLKNEIQELEREWTSFHTSKNLPKSKAFNKRLRDIILEKKELFEELIGTYEETHRVNAIPYPLA